MAKVSAFSSLPSSFYTTNRHRILSPIINNLHYQVATSFSNNLTLKNNNKRISKISPFNGIRRLKSVEEETQVSEQVEGEEEAEQQTVSVPVSPSDSLTMYFQAEGTMSEAAIPAVTKALEGTEGVTDLKVQVYEGIASVELTKQTTVQATGVASSLVELIQGSGFKLQTLNLSFEDEENYVVV